MKLTIETDIPMPKYRGMTFDLLEAFKKMQAGDSLLFPKEHAPTIERAIGIFRQEVSKTARFVKGESAAHPTKIRIWRKKL